MEILSFKKYDPRSTKDAQIKDVWTHIRKRESHSAALLSEPQVEFDACLVCGSTENQQEIFTRLGFHWIYCPNCTHKYKKHMPDYERIVEQIRTQGALEIYLDELDYEYRLKHISKPNYDFMMRYYEGSPGRWLDIATGIGDMPHYLCQMGWDVDATELNPIHTKAGSERLPFVPKEQTLFEYIEGFRQRSEELHDIVSTFGYFDMLPEPVEHVKGINEILVMGGLLGVKLPRSESLTGAFAELWPDTALRVINPVFYSYYSEKSLFHLLDQGGFEPLGIYRHGCDIHELAMRMTEHAEGFGGSPAAEILYDLFNDLQRVIDEAGKSDLMLVCARKVREV